MLVPASAWAQEPAPAPAPEAPPPAPPAPEAPSTPAPAPAPAPAPSQPAHVTARAERVHLDGRTRVVLAGDAFRIAGALAPAAAGERVVLRVLRDGRPTRTRRIAVRPDGRFVARIRAPRPGRLRIHVVHRAGPVLGAAAAAPVRVTVVAPRAAPGDRGPLVRLLQRGLARLRYAVSRSGVFDAATSRAVMAYRKVNWRTRRFDADRAVVRRVLAGRGAFVPRHPEAGRHVEADLSRQVLALIDRRRVVVTYTTSSGKPSTPTVIGSFRVYLKTPGTNVLGMVDSSYFIRGYAIHGYVDVPAFRASNGCLRVPVADARRIYDWLHLGDRVIVYP